MSNPKHNPPFLEVFAHSLQEIKNEILPNCADTTISSVAYSYVLKPYCDNLVNTITPEEYAINPYAEYQPYWRKALTNAVGSLTTEVVNHVLDAALPSLGGLEKIISHASGKIAGKLASRVAENSAPEADIKPSI